MGFKAITKNTSPEDAPHILSEDDAAIYRGILGQDGVLNIGSKLKSTVISNNKVRVGDGVINVDGHIGRNAYADYEDLTIENGAAGKKRHDLIVASFSTTGSGGLDTYVLKVIKGAAGTTGADPAVTKQDIYAGGKLREYPLYRVKLDGLSIVAVDQMFKVIPTVPELEKKYNELNSALSGKSDKGHTHDDRYYTESEVDEKVNEVRSKRTQLAAGDYYYSGSIAFYVYGNGVVQVDGYTATMKQSIPLNSYSVIGYIPSGLTPNNEFYFPCFAGGKIIGMVALSPNGNISLFPYQDVKGIRLTFSTCYTNF